MLKNRDIDPYKLEYDAFQKLLKGESFSIYEVVVLCFKSLLSIFEGIFRHIPGALGYKLRYYYYKLVCKRIGQNVLIDVGVILSGTANISIDDYTWIDANCIISAMLGEVSIGKRVHMASFSIIGSREPVIIEDYVALGASSKIYSNSEVVVPGKRMSGPMIPEEDKAFFSAPVYLRKDSFVGANSVIMPGVELGIGAVVGANSLVTKSVAAWTIVSGVPARKLMAREKFDLPDY
ncbi:acyltransferase [Polynucleobacter necessarius]|uniref:acyltransferase n=1 Tax=Polynucleobacter necessarius TaxID=576610 RepID=UPI000E093051|nr:DapH/DapD/GlmU-related protein [Polynucleobacter necessarius]